jgi:hypothetical protein
MHSIKNVVYPTLPLGARVHFILTQLELRIAKDTAELYPRVHFVLEAKRIK